MPPPKKPRCRDAPWFFLAREGLSARPEWARNRRWTMPCNVSVRGAFQLTPSARRATKANLSGTASTWNFNPRPPRGGRPDGAYTGGTDARISIHALREEGDQHRLRCRRRTAAFQSTPSARRATVIRDHECRGKNISIHALREEGDWPNGPASPGSSNFNPRPPRGGRPPSRRCWPMW